MRKFMIKPDSGHPYTNIRQSIPHEYAGKAGLAHRGEVLLKVLHNNGRHELLAFYHTEIEEVKP